MNSNNKIFVVCYILHSDKTWHLDSSTLNSPLGYVQGMEQLYVKLNKANLNKLDEPEKSLQVCIHKSFFFV